MSLTSLRHELGRLHSQPNWQAQKHLQMVLTQWLEVVGTAVAAQTHPYAIQRGVLYVATSSPIWAQNLAFQRQVIIEKLNARLKTRSLSDIRFSTQHWQSRPSSQRQSEAAERLWIEHPSRIQTQAKDSISKSGTIKDPNDVFQRWATTMQARSQHLPHCSACQCPTPTGELQRWGVCAMCAIQKWGDR